MVGMAFTPCRKHLWRRPHHTVVLLSPVLVISLCAVLWQTLTPTIDRPLKPVADVFMFIEDKKADYKKKFPTMDDNELRRFMVKEFNCISERDKVQL